MPAYIACGPLARPEQGDLERHVPGSAEAGVLQLFRSIPHLLAHSRSFLCRQHVFSRTGPGQRLDPSSIRLSPGNIRGQLVVEL